MRTELYKATNEVFVDFKDINEARAYAKEIGGDVVLLTKKLGERDWSHFELHDEPLSLREFFEDKDNYYIHEKWGIDERDDEYYSNVVVDDLRDACATIDNARKMLDYHEEIMEYRMQCEGDQFVLEYLNSQAFEILPNYCMQYNGGSTLYAIGVMKID